MTPLEEALVESVAILDSRSIPYAVIGGLANAVWGHPRATLDVDLVLWASDERIPEVAAAFAPSFRALVQEPAAFVSRTRVLPVESRRGVRVDLIWGMLPFEEQAVGRASPHEIAGHAIRFVTAEDLILYKISSERKRDQEDVEGVIAAQGGRLDRPYLDAQVRALSELLEDPDILQRYRNALDRLHP